MLLLNNSILSHSYLVLYALQLQLLCVCLFPEMEETWEMALRRRAVQSTINFYLPYQVAICSAQMYID